jgi:hypothetical protein
MTDTSSPIDPQDAPPGIDISVAHPARVYDYILGGTNHFPADRELADQLAAATGGLDVLRAYARANRDFLGRAVRHLVVEAGVRQFIDIGTGIPSDDNVHGVAQRTAPDARVVYVDRDPLVLAHANVLLQSTPQGTTAYINSDLRNPRSILLRAEATLDFNEPIAVMLIGILHMIGDEDEPYGIVSQLMEAVPAGSYLVMTHMASDIEVDKMAEFARAPERISQQLPFVIANRTSAEVARFFEGLDLVDPGVVRLDQWRPDPDADAAHVGPVPPLHGGVGRKP